MSDLPQCMISCNAGPTGYYHSMDLTYDVMHERLGSCLQQYGLCNLI